MQQVIALLTLSEAADACVQPFLEAFLTGAPLPRARARVCVPALLRAPKPHLQMRSSHTRVLMRCLHACLRAACAAGTDAAAEASWAPAAAAAAAAASRPGGAPLFVAAPRSRCRFTLLRAHPSDLLSCLEAVKCADLLLVVQPAGAPGDVSPAGAAALPALRALGLPPALGAICFAGDAAAAAAPKARAAARKAAEGALLGALGVMEPRALPADAGTDAAEFLRALAGVRTVQPPWRALRPYVLAHDIQFIPDAAADSGATGTLLVSGYIRGAPLCADQLGYLPGIGEFQFEAIEAAEEPAFVGAPVARPRKAGGTADMECEGADGSAAPLGLGLDGLSAALSTPQRDTQESLQRENIPDPLAGEQTWPTEDEMADAAAATARAAAGGAGGAGGRRRMVRRPKGMSDYQAAWIPESSSDVEEEEEDGGRGRGGGGGGDAMHDDDDDAADAAAAADDDDDDDEEELLEEDEMTQDEAMAAARHDSERRLALRRAGAAAEAAEQEEFPDEVDTPLDVRASVRFARYRGLKSLRTSAWDPYESLPADYSRIFAFQSFSRTRRRALAAAAAPPGAPGVPPGACVRARLARVPAAAAAAFAAAAATSPAVLLGLLQHEAKLSVCHVALTKTPSFAPPLRSKAPLAALHIGFRRLLDARPIYSQDGRGDKFKYERFLRPGAPTVASMFAPIAFGPAPVLAFASAAEENADAMGEAAPGGAVALAASGTLRPADPERVILKRAVITGYPHKIHKKKAVIRFMFHSPEDVRWFRPLELWTKYGRHGRIREPLGTHGSMKAAFDGVLQQRDTVCASLYKRVFPKLPPAA
jgi:pre-rRNA-processing protein TSR1